jgi:hypothetical protein
MKKILSNDPVRMEIVSRLVKEGAIDFAEAIKLLEVEVEKEIVTVPLTNPFPDPFLYPNRGPLWQVDPFQTICGSPVSNNILTTSIVNSI